MSIELLERYYPVIDDVLAFKEAINRPLPNYVSVNTLRIQPDRLKGFLERDGFETTTLPWLSNGLRVEKINSGLGNHWTYLAGLYQIQEASAMIPALVLAPQPGERVLDLCAAPGNKSIQMAILLDNQGTVVANDPVSRRLKPLRAAIYRMGLLNITTTCRDGLSYPHSAGKFDCVLVDAPCSCEGISRKRPKVLHQPVKNPRLMINKQKRLLSEAIRFCKDGGRILYSTCTYAPEENELVIDDILSENRDRVILLPIRIPNLKSTKGLTKWSGKDLHPDLKKTLRLWPHQNDTGGFFMALLQKGKNSSDSSPRVPQVDDPDYQTRTDDFQAPFIDQKNIFALLQDRFGMKASGFDPYIFFTNSSGIVHAIVRDHIPPLIPDRVMGLPLIYTAMRYPKITTNGAMAFGHLAEKHVIELEPEQMKTYFSRSSFSISSSQATFCDSDGYVILRYERIPLGVGFYKHYTSQVASLFPKKLALGK